MGAELRQGKGGVGNGVDLRAEFTQRLLLGHGLVGIPAAQVDHRSAVWGQLPGGLARQLRLANAAHAVQGADGGDAWPGDARLLGWRVQDLAEEFGPVDEADGAWGGWFLELRRR